MAVRMRTTGVATFTATADWADAPTHVGAWIGTNFIGWHMIPIADVPEILEANDTYTVPIGTMYDWTLTPAGGAGIDADAGMAALMNSGADEVSLRFSLHNGSPGNLGTANELVVGSNPGYSRQAAVFEVVAT